ncbi:uncharacterized protein LOC115398879 [Salarias fasciatus]|uniref:uncharacterized protein LOC115398879 n=1 Tax=Salarias fasciatus TaxID=181472 RepID=UPI001176C6C9|nr:uncharacterized protein LOC115398879 [Salarias fasciatus]
MGQLFSSSSEEELAQVRQALGSLLYDAMLEGGAVPDLRVEHPLLLTGHEDGPAPQDRLREQLQQLQSDMGNKAPTYLRDLIGRLSAFSEEPRLAGLVGLAVTMVMDMAYMSSRQSSGAKGKAAGSSSCQQRVVELQEVMEEYLKRCRISLSDKSRLIQDSVRLEAQLSLTLTQLRTCLLGGDCSSRSLRYWASAAAFHTQMLIHLARMEGKAEPACARAALEQYREDLSQIIPVYRRYKQHTVSVVKRRGGPLQPSPEPPEEGAMTGLTVTDRETGKSVSLSLSDMEAEAGRRIGHLDPSLTSSLNLDSITSEQYAQAYLDHLFSGKGPVEELQGFFSQAAENLRTLRINTVACKDKARGEGAPPREERTEQRAGREETEKLSIVETQPEQNLSNSAASA